MWPAWVVQVVIAVAMMVVSYLLTPKPKVANPAAAEDLDIPTAQEGETIPILFGTVDIKAANVAWYGAVSSRAIKGSGSKK